MVKKSITYFLIFSILGFALLVSQDTHALIKHVKGEVQENIETDSFPSKDEYKDKYGINPKLSVPSIEAASIRDALQQHFWNDRRVFLLPVFYQSNYVIENL